MKIASVLTAVTLSVVLSACGSASTVEQEPAPQGCPVGTVADGDGLDAHECEPDENQNGIGDDDEQPDTISEDESTIGAVVGGLTAAEKARKAFKKKKARTKPRRR